MPFRLTPQGSIGVVEGAIAAQDVKKSCRLATTGPIVLSGLQTIDGVMTAAGDRVLVKDQADARTNGIYIAGTGAWERAEDFKTSEEVSSGLFTFVAEGATQADSGFLLITDDPITLGVDPLIFTAFSGPTVPPLPHASSHMDGGSDEVATATPTANAIPKADAAGKLNSWVDLPSNYYDATFIVGSLAEGATHTTLASAVASITGPTLIRLRPGIHAIASKITVPYFDVAIIGAGPGATIVKLDNGVNDSGIDYVDPNIGTIRDFFVADFTIDGNKVGQTDNGNGLIRAYTRGTISVRNVHFVNSKRSGLFAQANQLFVSDCLARACEKDGFELYSSENSEILLCNCWASANGKSGFGVHGFVHLANCVSRSNLQNGVGGTWQAWHPYRLGISGGYYYGNNVSGINVAAQCKARITGAYINSNVSHGIVMYEGEATIGNCHVASNGGDGICLWGDHPTTTLVCISNNHVLYNGNHGIRLTGMSGVVTGNRVENNGVAASDTYNGIYLNGSYRSSVVGNMVRGDNHKYGIEEDVYGGVGDYNLISCNNVTAGVSGAIASVGANTIVSGNLT